MGKGKDRYQVNHLQLRRGDDLDSIINSNLGFVDGEIIIVKDRKTVVCAIDDEQDAVDLDDSLVDESFFDTDDYLLEESDLEDEEMGEEDEDYAAEELGMDDDVEEGCKKEDVDMSSVDITTGETVHHIEKSKPTIKEKAIKKERTAISFLFIVLLLSCLAGIGVVLANLAHPFTDTSKTTIFIMCAFLCMSAFVDGILFENL